MDDNLTTQPNRNFWDERYSMPDFAFGTQPNLFFKQQLDKLNPGKLLLPAEGEGRNAVYAASNGWKVTAFDLSKEGMKKALQLADIKHVSFDYHIADIENIEFPLQTFNAIGLIYIHFQKEKRENYYNKLLSYLSPGGTIILECFSKDQIRFNSGGPKEESLLLSPEDIEKDFRNIEIVTLNQEIITLDEGLYHSGEASVVRLVARKPE